MVDEERGNDYLCIIGYQKVHEETAELYRQDKLQDKNMQELCEKKEKLQQKFADSGSFDLSKDNMKLLAIEKELHARSEK